MNTKKGDITMETIVLAALALLFFIVVAFVMTGKIGNFSKSISDCESKNGLCVAQNTCAEQYGGTEIGFACADKVQVCCFNTCQAEKGTCSDDACTSGQQQIYTAGCPNEKVCCK